MGRIERSWALVKASAGVLNSNRGLLVFPLLSGICALLVAASFFVPLGLVGGFAMLDGEHAPVWLWPFLFVFYLVQYFVIFFFNAALVGAARMNLDGESPTVGDGLRIATDHWREILGYALIAATVGLLLRMLEERAGFIGRWIIGLIGVAWTVATFLVVPVLVNEQVGPVDAVKRSAELLKKTWGENLAGNLGMGLLFGVFFFLWVAGGAVLLAMVGAHSIPASIAIGLLLLIGVLTIVLVQSALQGVYAAALHRYADTGDAGGGFEQGLIADAFKVKA